MNEYFVDLHIHLGRTKANKPVKITAANTLTLKNIIPFAKEVKGMDMIGIIDCHVPEIIEEIRQLIAQKEAFEQEEGGIVFGNGLVLLLGTEIEIDDEHSLGPIHVLVFFPFLQQMSVFSEWLAARVKNITLSTQRIYESGRIVQEKVKALDGLFIPAHIFTPYKSLYGKGVKTSLAEVFHPKLIDAVELGLSSDTEMAQNIAELARYPFLSNSDAHSLEKIAREYQIVRMKNPTFIELKKALQNKEGRKIVRNYGLDPRLGKYFFTCCERCGRPIDEKKPDCCKVCGHSVFVKGVYQRIKELSGKEGKRTSLYGRPPYIHQVPLQFIPKLGPKRLEKLRERFGTDMNIIHEAAKEDLEQIVPEEVSENILLARIGKLSIQSGGAGRYGKVE